MGNPNTVQLGWPSLFQLPTSRLSPGAGRLTSKMADSHGNKWVAEIYHNVPF